MGTQMSTVSTSASSAKSVVARRYPDSTTALTSSPGTSPIYDSPRLICSTFYGVDVERHRLHPGLGELDRQRQPDIAQTDHANPRLARGVSCLQAFDS